MLDQFKQEVWNANIDLVKYGLVLFTWGNASTVIREQNLIVIKPSGIKYSEMQANDMVVVDFEGNIVEGHYKPSSDLATHIEIYKAFHHVGGIVHTHSTYATAWSQAGIDMPISGTTQADYFYGDVPCTRDMTESEVKTGYEKNTGLVIAERFATLNPTYIPGVLVKNHGPFTWGKNVDEAVHNSVVLEEIAKINHLAIQINPKINMNQLLTEKHFNRKHGKNAYYGQV